MNVLLINTSDAGGGAQEVGAQLLAGLRARGFAARLAVGHTPDPHRPGVEVIPNFEARPLPARLAAHAAHRLGRPGGLVERLGEPRRAVRRWRGDEDFDFPGTWRLLDGTAVPDVVHAHNLHGDYFDLRALPAFAARCPVVLTLHDGWALTGHCAHSFECDRWESGCGPCPHLDVPPAVPRDRTAQNWERKRRIYRSARVHVVTPSAWLLERVRRSILAPAVIHAEVIPNGVDLDVFRPGPRAEARARLGLADDAHVILFSANSTASNPFKDFATLEAVLARLGARTGKRVILLSVGEEGASRTVGRAELRMVGHQGDPANLVPFYQAADVYLHPALADTFPTTILEAHAAGLPVVASAVGGIPEQVEEGVTGALVPAQAAAPMAAAVEALLDDEARRNAASSAARARAEARFDARRMVADYVSLYERAIAERARPEANRSSSSSESSRIRTR